MFLAPSDIATGVSGAANAAARHPGAVIEASAQSLGALFVGAGAVLLLISAVAGSSGLTGVTFGGTLARPDRRLFYGCDAVGAIVVTAGSGLLLSAARQLTWLVVLLTVLGAAGAVYVTMALKLRQHLTLVARETGISPRSLGWCLRNPRWRPPQ